MTQDFDNEPKKLGQGESSYGVILPCDPEDFADFVSGLLGQPQTMERGLYGTFEITKENLSAIFQLVEQRVHQQNEANLVQFTVRMVYTDGSSVLLNSISQLNSYSEIRPLRTGGVVLSWSYLVKFLNKKVPERQTIDVSFMAGDDDAFTVEDGVLITRMSKFREVGAFVRIEHSDRTWGVDIDSLLTGYIKTHFRRPSRTREFVFQHSEGIGQLVAAFFFLSAVVWTYFTFSSFRTAHASAVENLKAASPTGLDSLVQKADFMLDTLAAGAWPRFIFASISYVLLALVVAVICGFLIDSLASRLPRSLVRFTRLDDEAYAREVKRRQRDWTMFWLAIILSTIGGIASNLVFSYYFGTPL